MPEWGQQSDGLIAWWPFDGRNAWRVEYMRGQATASALTGFSQPLVSVRNQPCLLLSAPFDLVVPPVVSLPLSISCWVELFSATTATVFYLGNNAAWHAFYLSVGTTSAAATHTESANFATATHSMGAAIGTCEHYVCVFESLSSRKLYCNGLLVASDFIVLPAENSKNLLRLGGTWNTPAGQFKVFDLRVYSKALSDSEVYALYDPATRYARFRSPWQEALFQFVDAGALLPPALSVPVTLFAPTVATTAAPVTPPLISSLVSLFAPLIIAPSVHDVPLITSTVTLHAPLIAESEASIVEDSQILEPHNFKVRMVDFVAGDDVRVSRIYTGLPAGIGISKAYLTIKTRCADSSTVAVLQKAIFPAPSGDGHITDDSSTGGSIAMFFDLDQTETALLTPLVPYSYDVQVITDAQAVYTCEMGIMVMQRGVTEATS